MFVGVEYIKSILLRVQGMERQEKEKNQKKKSLSDVSDAGQQLYAAIQRRDDKALQMLLDSSADPNTILVGRFFFISLCVDDPCDNPWC